MCNSISESWITNWGIRDKIRSVLQTLSFNCLPTLAQFWAPVTIQNRMISMEYKFYVDGDSEEELGLPGRVFRYKFLESTPDVRYYSTKEHPQGSHAVHCNVTQSLALPVFDPSSQSCVGVLELVTLTHDADELLIKMEDQISEALQKVELEYSDPYFHGDILGWEYTRFSIADYPLAHYACKFGLTGCFAICINKGHGDLQTSLSMILGTIMQLLKGFKLATGEKVRQDLSIEVIDFCNDEKLDSRQTPQTNRYSTTLPSQNIREMTQLDSSNQESMDAINNGRNDVSAEQSNIHGTDVQKKSKTKRRRGNTEKVEFQLVWRISNVILE
ncbi:unnamed protein product [Camellia sinensis]